MKHKVTRQAGTATQIPITFFAPAERKPIEVVHRQARRLGRSRLTHTFRNATSNYLFLLNAQRQIVMASENVLDLVTNKTMDQIVGLRFGEALKCIHAHDCEGGCGTSRLCRHCGVVKIILSGLAGVRDVETCRLTRWIKGRRTTLELEALATPLVRDRERYTLLTVADVTPEKSNLQS